MEPWACSSWQWVEGVTSNNCLQRHCFPLNCYYLHYFQKGEIHSWKFPFTGKWIDSLACQSLFLVCKAEYGTNRKESHLFHVELEPQMWMWQPPAKQHRMQATVCHSWTGLLAMILFPIDNHQIANKRVKHNNLKDFIYTHTVGYSLVEWREGHKTFIRGGTEFGKINKLFATFIV